MLAATMKIIVLLVTLGLSCVFGETEEESAARLFLNEYEAKQSEQCNKYSIANWNHGAHITEENEKLKLEASLEHAKFTKELWRNVTKFNWTNFEDPDLKRKFRLQSILGTAVLPEQEYKELQEVLNKMETIYSSAKVCDFKNTSKCDLNLEPELKDLFSKSRNASELSDAWIQWRDQSGKKMRKLFTRYVQLLNKAATMNNFRDATAQKLYSYTDSDDYSSFQTDIKNLWLQMKPFYEQLHAYVRGTLRRKYGSDVISAKGPIPAHLLGNMWSQTWGNILDISEPYPGKQSVDVTPNMIKQGYTADKIFRVSEEFFTSLNLTAMPESFWERSIIEKPADGRELVCHASAWDFCDQKDVRIKQCTKITMEDLIVVHHEMGHIQYFLQYKDQPLIYREGANPGFHEAIGDVLALSVATPKHMEKIGLFLNLVEDPQIDMNFLYRTALQKIAFLPYGYILDLWRWDIYSGKTQPEDYNCDWWKYRIEYQGVSPPVTRSEEDFDPGAKYHVASDVGYIRYFIAAILQFQFHKSLCLLANEYDPTNEEKPLYKCDIYKSIAAGNKLGDMLRLGSSKPWSEALETLTGSRKMDAGALLEYFKPLYDYLVEENKKSGEHIGWDKSGTHCNKSGK